jgi:hypothetical protein
VTLAYTSTGKRVIVPTHGFRRRALRPSDPYWAQWTELTRRQRDAGRATLLFLVLFPLTLLLVLPTILTALQWGAARIGMSARPTAVPTWLASVVLGILVVAPWLRRTFARPCSWRCPRCQLPFFLPEDFGEPHVAGMSATGVNVFWPVVQLCVHCGLAKWCPRDPDSDQRHDEPVVERGVGADEARFVAR